MKNKGFLNHCKKPQVLKEKISSQRQHNPPEVIQT